jgi:hypothetical protein
VLGAAQAISALGRTVGPPLIGTAYDVSPVTSFLLAGLFMVIAGLEAFRLPLVTHHRAADQAPPPALPPVPLTEPLPPGLNGT